MCTLLCELDAELSEVFACRGKVVSDDWDVLLDVHDDRSDVRTLVTHVLHALPWHLKRRGGPQTELGHQSWLRLVFFNVCAGVR